MRSPRLLPVFLLGACIVAAPTAVADMGDPFPPAGQDVFNSIFSHQALEILSNPFGIPVGDLPNVSFSGPTVVNRADPELGPGGLYQIPTEMISMDLDGSFGFVNATIHESATRSSVGLVRELTPGGAPGTFLADSFFDVFFEIEIEGGPTFYNRDPAYLYTGTISEVPPIGSIYSLAGWIDEGSPLIGDFVDLTGPAPAGFHPLPSDADPLRLFAIDPLTGGEFVVGFMHGMDISGHEVVPAPSAVVLGVLGLGMVGLIRHRRA